MQAKGKKAARKAGSDSEEEDMDISDESDGEWAQPAKPKVAALLSARLLLWITERQSEERVCLEGTQRQQTCEIQGLAQDMYRHAF